MNDFKKLARIVIIGLVLYILVQEGMWLLTWIPYIVISDSRFPGRGLPSLIAATLAIVYAGIIIYLLLYKSEKITEKIVGSEEPQHTHVWWLPFAFRLTSVFAGILYIYWAIERIVSSLYRYLTLRHGTSVSVSHHVAWDRVSGLIVLLVIGIYLLYGAPHFVRWQVKKTVEQCRKLEDIKELSDGD